MQLRARHVSAGIEIAWIRRTRLGGDLRDGTGSVALAEEREDYALEILSGPAGSAGSTVLRTITTSAPVALYTSAEIAADFGGMPEALSVSLTQISAPIGRGFARTVTLEIT
ncbi:MAG: hypothetical protein LAT68_16800 [Cyclobacteriaceae bacterium]|nr:hypothetical protein [Cyclobacteriaceae bacterium]